MAKRKPPRYSYTLLEAFVFGEVIQWLQMAWIGLASTYSLLGQEEEARKAAAKVLKINPKFSSERFIMSLPFKNQSENERIINALRKAGLK